MNRILLADPNPTLRFALALLLETRLNAQIVGQVSSMEGLLCEAAVTQPEVVIIGFGLPGEPSKNRLAVLRCVVPQAAILFLTPTPEPASLGEGTSAYLCQADPPETILSIVQNALACAQLKEVCHV